ncbi:MAG TPA: hypothetical protein VI855_08155 [Dehalococcoidia bacterium]|nr:hypothetical protein [Dehalococcoidia bacterium]
MNSAQEAGYLLERLPALWPEADLAEHRKTLLAILEAVYMDAVEEKSIVNFCPSRPS